MCVCVCVSFSSVDMQVSYIYLTKACESEMISIMYVDAILYTLMVVVVVVVVVVLGLCSRGKYKNE